MIRAALTLALVALPVAAGLCQPGPPAAARPDLPFSPAAIAEQQARFARWKTALPRPGGPLPVVREEVASLPDHTIFRPASLQPGRPLPVVVFGNGGCRSTPIEFTGFLTEVASHGYVVVAAGDDATDFGVEDLGARSANGKPLQRVSRTVLTEATDWAARETARPDSRFFHRLDLSRLAYMGQSCGGIQALSASVDPRTRTTVVLNSGRLPADAPLPKGARLPEAFEWSDLHAPIVFFSGGPGDLPVAHQNFAEIDKLPVFLADLPVGHVGAYPGPDPRWVKAVVGWLDWQLKGDARAKTLFVGADCSLCRDPAWTVTGGKHLG